MLKTTRREALVSIAAGLSATSLPAQQPYQPTTFSKADYELLGTLVDLILPPSGTPGARAVGVHAMIDEDLADGGSVAGVLRQGLERLREAGFESMAAQEQIDRLTRISKTSGEDGEFFETLKGLTIDAYYSTEVGLVQELGYQGNTYLAEFPGCTHEHVIEDAD